MDRDAGVRALGLDPGVGKKRIQKAYKARSRSLKERLIGAAHADEKERFRRELRELVRTREIALGRPPPESWKGRSSGISGTRLIEALGKTSARSLDRKVALAFFRLPPGAPAREVRDAYRLHARALVRSLGKAATDSELARIRRARGKLRTVRNYALA